MTSSNPELVWFPTCFYHFFFPFLRVGGGIWTGPIVTEHLFIREFECLSVCVFFEVTIENGAWLLLSGPATIYK